MARSAPIPSGDAHGFILFASLLVLSLATLLVLMSHARLSRRIQVQIDLERRLYSVTAAANGIELTKTLLPRLDLEDILSSADSSGASRNPMPRERALSSPLDDLNGLSVNPLRPFENGADAVWTLQGGATAFVRLSNNPEEETIDMEQDGVVIVRSMGVAASRSGGLFPEILNSVTIVEARLRQERLFEAPAAVLFFAAVVNIETDGTPCPQIAAENHPSFGAVSRQPVAVNQSLSPDQEEGCLALPAETIADFTDEYLSSPTQGRLFRQDFWTHFVAQLPDFAIDSTDQAFRYLPDGGRLDGEERGLLVARGPLVLSEEAHFEGLLIHLGDGPLELERGARVDGAVWMASPVAEAEPDSGSVTLVLARQAQIVLGPDQVEKALWLFPPTQLGWRVVAPEME